MIRKKTNCQIVKFWYQETKINSQRNFIDLTIHSFIRSFIVNKPTTSDVSKHFLSKHRLDTINQPTRHPIYSMNPSTSTIIPIDCQSILINQSINNLVDVDITIARNILFGVHRIWRPSNLASIVFGDHRIN